MVPVVYLNPAEFTLEPQQGWLLSKVIATLEAEKTIESDGPPVWKLATGGCLVAEYSKVEH